MWLSVAQAEAIADALDAIARVKVRVEEAQRRAMRSDRSDVSPIVGARMDAYEDVLAWIEGAAASLDPLNHAGRPAEVAANDEYIPNKGASDVV